MSKHSDDKRTFPYLRKPWILETIFFFVVLWQESFRLSSRTSHKILPLTKRLQHIYYYNFGDFVNGYVIAFIVDGVSNLFLFKQRESYKLLGFKISTRKNAFLASLISIFVVAIFELTQSTSTTSDINDIPAGVLGAILYFFIRLLALKLTSEYGKASK
ncbi:MAG: hypothetical protein IPP48_05960 [Chitinophagaceae bacterium]|nr:hypothetical protein [Chitinophagaceae bacterium]